MRCPNCSFENQAGAVNCASCGAQLEQQQASWQPPSNVDNQTFTPAQAESTPETAAADSKSIVSLVMGIIGMVFCFVAAGVILGPLAISRGKQARLVLDESSQNFWIALAGIITGIIGLALSIIFAIVYLFVFVIGALAII